MAEFVANRPAPEFPVTAMMVKGEPWTPGINSIGFVEPNQGVSLEAELSGKVVAINFESGQSVKLNQVLVDKGDISKENFDKSQSDYQELLAQIEGLKATIERHNIIAPFSGTTGIRNIHLGQYLQPGDKITRLEDTSLMRIRFTIAQSDISRIFVGQLRSGMFTKITIVLPTEEKQMVLPQTAVSFALYGESVFVIEEVKDKTGQLYKKVKQVVVKVSARMGNKVKINSGIMSGDQIVTSGQVKLSNGSRVKIVKSDTLTPPAQLPKL